MARENDIVLLYVEDSPVTFARVEEIHPDVKKNWFSITLLMLQVPLQIVTWLLKDDYINGEDFFMGGKRMRLEKVERPDKIAVPGGNDRVDDSGEKTGARAPGPGKKSRKDSKVVSLADIRKAREQQ